jgi:hypothetical protein
MIKGEFTHPRDGMPGRANVSLSFDFFEAGAEEGKAENL